MPGNKKVLTSYLQENQCLGHAGIERKRIFAGDKEEGNQQEKHQDKLT